MIIVGAGLTGLIAGYIFPNASIIERRPGPTQQHRALLRFRGDAISTLTGIPFRKVRVHKGIYSAEDGGFCACNIRLANLYALKCTGSVLNRSIWDLDPVDRFVAPEDFYERMVLSRAKQIEWGHPADPAEGPQLSTIPLPQAVEAFLPSEEWPAEIPQFKAAPISVRRMRLNGGADVHQTIYFPGPEAGGTYRISVTGDLVIQESMHPGHKLGMMDVEGIFGLPSGSLTLIDEVEQSFGKIAPIDDRIRRELIYKLTAQANVYSVGRFATWRNILLDDVLNDLRVVKGMMEQQDAYSMHKAASRR